MIIFGNTFEEIGEKYLYVLVLLKEKRIEESILFIRKKDRNLK